ncbi:hypothetical protein OQA88_8370 [Cercophora sp. LCS_1]
MFIYVHILVRTLGVSHLFYSSLTLSGPINSDTSVAEVMGSHLDTQAYLAKTSSAHPNFSYTSIREGIYAESTPHYTGFFNPRSSNDIDTTEILIPHDGKGRGITWAKRDELGEATANVIAEYWKDAENFEYVNTKIMLTGPREWSLEETVEVLGRVVGREELGIREVSVEEYVQSEKVHEALGGEDIARRWAAAFEAIRRGDTGVVTGDLERWLGREPMGFEEVVRGCWGTAKYLRYWGRHRLGDVRYWSPNIGNATAI